MGRMGFYFDAVNCIGCRTCQIACKDKNALPVGMLFRRVVTVEAGRFPEGSFFHISEGCNHCEDPACVSNCPSGACAKNEQGLVTIDEEICIGCRSCVMSCPYGQPQYDAEASVSRKCDGCSDLTAAGGNPVCVDSCLMRCLEFGDLDDLRALHGEGLVSEIPVLPSASETNPSLLINPRACALEEEFTVQSVY